MQFAGILHEGEGEMFFLQMLAEHGSVSTRANKGSFFPLVMKGVWSTNSFILVSFFFLKDCSYNFISTHFIISTTLCLFLAPRVLQFRRNLQMIWRKPVTQFSSKFLDGRFFRVGVLAGCHVCNGGMTQRQRTRIFTSFTAPDWLRTVRAEIWVVWAHLLSQYSRPSAQLEPIECGLVF